MLDGIALARPSSRDDFEIAIVCALRLEFDAVCLVVDEFWDANGDHYRRARGDQNTYTPGRIGNHNVVLVLLPSMGKASSAAAAANLRHSYNSLKVVLLTGVCGGVPGLATVASPDIFLGDVVISQQVVQFDFGRQYPGQFMAKEGAADALRRPNREISTILAVIKTEHGFGRLEHNSAKVLSKLQARAENEELRVDYRRPRKETDCLFPADYTHKHRDTTICGCSQYSHPCPDAIASSCDILGCDTSQKITRQRAASPADADGRLRIYVGAVGSADTVMKSGVDRDNIAARHDLIAFEMEAAGMWEELPCIVVKGVCDYADSHKAKGWQPFSAASAAAVTKALLSTIQATDRLQKRTSSKTAKLETGGWPTSTSLTKCMMFRLINSSEVL
ncbi:phosphorylase superfamily protein [Microdochium bolleyi]|uniref:Phosphorylase superfamily protein n=1 Tax=Microdochium bolleyi TaxID=196109 RepID=A0A136IU75_9PEZI|nr:phosphorylase superfamily protein [Microdochium bolleyi]